MPLTIPCSSVKMSLQKETNGIVFKSAEARIPQPEHSCAIDLPTMEKLGVQSFEMTVYGYPLHAT